MLCETLVWIWQLHYSSKEHQAAVLILMGSIIYNQTNTSDQQNFILLELQVSKHDNSCDL